MKNGVLKLDESLTVGEVLDGYCDCKAGTAQWEQKVSTRGAQVVVFTCDLKNAATALKKLKPVVISKIYRELAKQSVSEKTVAKQLDKYEEEIIGILEDAEKPNQANTKIFSYRIELASCDLAKAKLLIPFVISKANRGQFKINGDSYIRLTAQDPNMEEVTVTLDSSKLLRYFIYPNKPAINELTSGSFWQYLTTANQPH